jgi:cobalt-zinc-cadmium efflux system outer membrane protein
MKRKSYFLVATFCGLLAGCVHYHELPLPPAPSAKTLKPPSMEDLRIGAKEIKHPILKPLDVDIRKGLSPKEAALIAVLANPKLRAVRDQKGIAGVQLLQAGILPNPQFSYSLDFPTGGNTQGTFNAYGLGLNWDIQSLILRGAKIDAARASAASVDLDVAWQEWQMAQAAKMHVYHLFFLQKQLAVAKEQEKGFQENLKTVRQAVDSGYMTIIDLAAADAALQRAHASTLALEQREEQERLALNQTLGFPPEHTVPLQQDLKPPSFKTIPSLAEIMHGLQERRLDLLAFKMGYQSEEARLRAAVRAQFPRITIGLSHARDVSDVITTGFGITIDLPFFDRNQGRIAIEEASRKQLFDEYIFRLFDARAGVARILADGEALQKQIRATEESLPVLKNLIQIYHQALLEGNADILSYYNARDRLLTSTLALFELRRTLADLYIALEIAAGEYLEPDRGGSP